MVSPLQQKLSKQILLEFFEIHLWVEIAKLGMAGELAMKSDLPVAGKLWFSMDGVRPGDAAQKNMAEMWNFEFWNTGNAGTWVWERITVNLEKGNNTINISPEKYVLMDHLNIVKINKN